MDMYIALICSFYVVYMCFNITLYPLCTIIMCQLKEESGHLRPMSECLIPMPTPLPI